MVEMRANRAWNACGTYWLMLVINSLMMAPLCWKL